MRKFGDRLCVEGDRLCVNLPRLGGGGSVAEDRGGGHVKRRDDEPGKQELLCLEGAGPGGEAQTAEALGFTARILVQATMPHSDPGEARVFGRHNGYLSLSIQAGLYVDRENRECSVGLPYGSLPRVLLIWLTTEAVRTKSRELELGPNLSAFMQKLGLVPTGGRWGSIPRLREQMRRLFAASVSYVLNEEKEFAVGGMRVVEEARLFWENGGGKVASLEKARAAREHKEELFFLPQPALQAGRWKSGVLLGEKFFKDVLSRPVPIDLRAITQLRQSPLSLDIYCWLTHRVSYLTAPTLIPWPALLQQFGASYTRAVDFKVKFQKRLKDVLEVYPQV
jgi:hypothetical protein